MILAKSSLRCNELIQNALYFFVNNLEIKVTNMLDLDLFLGYNRDFLCEMDSHKR